MNKIEHLIKRWELDIKFYQEEHKQNQSNKDLLVIAETLKKCIFELWQTQRKKERKFNRYNIPFNQKEVLLQDFKDETDIPEWNPESEQKQGFVFTILMKPKNDDLRDILENVNTNDDKCQGCKSCTCGNK